MGVYGAVRIFCRYAESTLATYGDLPVLLRPHGSHHRFEDIDRNAHGLKECLGRRRSGLEADIYRTHGHNAAFWSGPISFALSLRTDFGEQDAILLNERRQ
jgi:hypothetical protein